MDRMQRPCLPAWNAVVTVSMHRGQAEAVHIAHAPMSLLPAHGYGPTGVVYLLIKLIQQWQFHSAKEIANQMSCFLSTCSSVIIMSNFLLNKTGFRTQEALPGYGRLGAMINGSGYRIDLDQTGRPISMHPNIAGVIFVPVQDKHTKRPAPPGCAGPSARFTTVAISWQLVHWGRWGLNYESYLLGNSNDKICCWRLLDIFPHLTTVIRLIADSLCH